MCGVWGEISSLVGCELCERRADEHLNTQCWGAIHDSFFLSVEESKAASFLSYGGVNTAWKMEAWQQFSK